LVLVPGVLLLRVRRIQTFASDECTTNATINDKAKSVATDPWVGFATARRAGMKNTPVSPTTTPRGLRTIFIIEVLPSCDLLVERISRTTLYISRTRVGGIGRRVDRGVEFHLLPPVSGTISSYGLC
jgi:hypothetical protein